MKKKKEMEKATNIDDNLAIACIQASLRDRSELNPKWYEDSFSKATVSAYPTSTEDMCVVSDSVISLSYKDGNSTIIERIIFSRIRLATGSNEEATSPSTYPLARQDAYNPIVYPATAPDCMGKSIPSDKGKT